MEMNLIKENQLGINTLKLGKTKSVESSLSIVFNYVLIVLGSVTRADPGLDTAEDCQ